jgi:hypothetical protein
MATFILKSTTSAVSTAGQLEFNTSKTTLVVGNGSSEVVIAKLNSVNDGAFYLNNAISTSGDLSVNNAFFLGNVSISGNLFLGNNTSDNINALGLFTSDLKPGSPNTYDIGTIGNEWRNIYANSISASNIVGSIGGIDIGLLGTRVNQLAAGTASVNGHTASVNGHITDINTKTGSFETKFLTLQTYTASVNGHITDINAWTASVNTNNTSRFERIEESTSSLNSFSASQLIKDSTLQTYTASVDAKFAEVQASTASLNTFTASNGNTSLNSYTASNDTTNTNQNNRLTRLEESTASLNSFSASENTKAETLRLYTASVDTKFSTLQTYTSSLDSTITRLREATASLNTFTQSIHQYTSSANQRLSALETQSGSDVSRLNNIESYTSSLKTAISLSGTNVTIAGNLTVQGTTTAVNSTTVQLGDNIIELNGNGAANGGIVVKDPTAPNTATGSLIWDSTNDYWKAGTINAETKILLAGGDSVVTSSAQVVGILESLNVFSASQENKDVIIASYTSSMNNHTASVNGHITDINVKTGSFETKFNSIQASTASLNTFSSSTLTRLSRIEESTASINVYTASINAFTASQLQKDSTLQTLTASMLAVDSRLQESTASLNTFSASALTRLSRLEESTSSLNSFSASENTKSETLRLYTASVDTKFSTLQTYTASIDSTIARLREATASLNLYTQSNDTTNNTQNIRLSRIEESTASLNTFSASINGHVADINIWSASVKGHIVDINDWTGSQKQKDTTLQNVTASLNLQTASFNTWTGSVFQPFSTSVDARLDQVEYLTSILTPAGLSASLTNINDFTKSTNEHILDINGWTGSINSKFNTLQTYTASVDSTIARLKESTASLNLFTQSYSTHSSSFDARLDVLEAYSSSQIVPTASLAERATQVDILVKNVSGAQIDKGKVVRIVGATGDNPLISTASYENDANSANTLGITTQNIPNDSFGYVVTEGILLGVNTTGMTAGQLIYLGANGTFTTTSPVAPLHGVRLGEVLRDQQNNGSIYVRIDNGSELGEAHDVVDSTTNSSYGDFLMKSGSIWINNSTFSASVNEHITDINAYTASNNTINTAQSNRLTRLEESTASINSYTASLKTAITIAGSDVTLNGNLTVAGTTTTINSTTVNIGDNIIQLNGTGTTNGGLVVRDATAATTTSGSLLWDTTNDRWIAGPLGAEAKVLTDGMGIVSGSFVSLLPTGVVSGSSQVIGILASLNSYTQSNDTTNTVQNNRLTRLEESTSSLNVFTASLSTTYEGRASAVKTLFSGSSQVNFTQLSGISANIISASSDTSNVDMIINGGSISANLYGGVISGSSQVNFTQLSGISNGIVSGSSQVTPLLPTGTVSGSAQIVGILSSLNTYTGSNDTSNTTQNNRLSRLEESTASLNTLTASLATTYEGRASAAKVLVSGSSQVNFTQLSGISANIISGSTNSTNVNFTISGGSITANLIGGVVSGSSQVNFTQLSGISNGIVSGAAQITPLLPVGTISGSAQVQLGSATGDITLGTQTTGNYIATIAGTSNQITVAGSGVETAAVTLSLPQNIHTSATPQFASLGIGMAASGTTGRIDATNDIVAFSSSDKRFKDNIKPIENALEKIQSVGGYEFDWKEENKIEHGYEGHDIGVIAQEIEAIAPELVQTRENGYKAVKYDKIVPLLIEAIKELSAKVKELENK